MSTSSLFTGDGAGSLRAGHWILWPEVASDKGLHFGGVSGEVMATGGLGEGSKRNQKQNPQIRHGRARHQGKDADTGTEVSLFKDSEIARFLVMVAVV